MKINIENKVFKPGGQIPQIARLKKEILTILLEEGKLNPDKKVSEYVEEFKLILQAL